MMISVTIPVEFTVAEVADQVRALGVRPGGVLVVHSSFRAVRPVEDGPLGLIHALRAALGPEGTLVMPTMTDGASVFDPDSTPTLDMGITAELFWQQPGVLRSTHPGASFAAEGPHAGFICRPQPLAPPHGPDSPIGRVHALDGQVLLLGVGHSENTTVHLAEAIAQVPYSILHSCVVESHGDPCTVMIPETDHCCRGFSTMDEWLRQRGAQREGKVANADARLCHSRDVIATAVAHLAVDPLVFLCPSDHGDDGCEQCHAARASVGRRRPLALLDVVERADPARPWAEGDNIPWNEPGFSARMLREHLSQDHDLASRKAATIDAHVAWLHHHVLDSTPGRVLDLACGPGLYAHRLAERGHRCVGLDFSPASIEHARAVAEARGLECGFQLRDLRGAALDADFQLVMMIYGQLNVFRRSEAEDILRRAHDALVPGGRLCLEVQTYDHVRSSGDRMTSWSTARAGLFSETAHLVLHEIFWDPDAEISTERWHVVDALTAAVERHALSNQAYTEKALTALLTSIGFASIEILPSFPASAAKDPAEASTPPSPMFLVLAQRSA